ncbi:MAG: ScyD/ScyE family protein [Actinomycetota bacterium]|nr:ScyD/ScyE family protein [Actinomycetota bacterium]
MSRSSKLVSSLATLALVGAGLGAVSAGQANAEAAAKPRAQTLAKGLISPLSLAVSKDGTRYVTQNFASLLIQQRPGQKPKVIYANKDGFEVGAVSEHLGSLRFALSKNQRRGVIMGVGGNGKPFPIADLGRFEKRTNPDAKNSYGFRGLDAECAAQMPEGGPPAAYQGIVETHPYATLMAGRTTYVADAAANAIFAIPRPGKVRTVAVLPPMPARITAEAGEMFGFPDCMIGKKYFFEAVPTDVERGPDGMLYVSTLPGGPEDPSLGARAAIFRVNPNTGKVTKVADGLLSATGLAVAKNGDIFVAELFRGRISRIKAGTSNATTFVEVPLPGDVELTGKGMFATINVLPGEDAPPNGKLVRIRR